MFRTTYKGGGTKGPLDNAMRIEYNIYTMKFLSLRFNLARYPYAAWIKNIYTRNVHVVVVHSSLNNVDFVAIYSLIP